MRSNMSNFFEEREERTYTGGSRRGAGSILRRLDRNRGRWLRGEASECFYFLLSNLDGKQTMFPQ